MRRVRRAVRKGGRELIRSASAAVKLAWEEYRIRYDLTICLTFRTAAPYLAEWIEFHLMVGVEHFYLYNNNSTDAYKSALEPYIRAGIVSLVEWPDSPPFPRSYEDCVARRQHEARWIAFLDDDEFLFPTKRSDLRKVLRDYERYPGVVVHWLVFGASGYLQTPAGLVTEGYLRREDQVSRYIKSIVNPRRVSKAEDPHYWRYKAKEWPVNEKKRRVIGSVSSSATADILRINHYTSKSAEDWMKKVQRGSMHTTETHYFMEAMRQREETLNSVEDRVIQRFVPELKRRLGARLGSGTGRG